MEFTHISNIAGFMNRVLPCEGPVDYVDDKGDMRDLKAVALQFSQLYPYFCNGEIRGLQVIASQQDDKCGS